MPGMRSDQAYQLVLLSFVPGVHRTPTPCSSLPALDILPLIYQKWTVSEMKAQFLRMFFVCATSPSLSASGSSMERIQKLVLVGSAITRKELPWTTLATLVTASCGDFGILRVDDSQAILGQCTGCRALAECAGVDYFVGPLVGAAAKSGPIMSWCQSFVLVWYCCRSCEEFRESTTRQQQICTFWTGTDS